jgi:hypothetical protein
MAGLYSVQSRSGMSYIGKINEEEAGVELAEADGKKWISSFNPRGKFLVLLEAYLLVPTTSNGKPDVYPLKFEETPTGGKSVALSIESINDINYIDENSQFVKALMAMNSNLVIPTAGESSRLIHKFGSR